MDVKFLAKQRYWIEKAKRAERFYTLVYGHVLEICGACNGSGYYDNTGSPKCGCCEGTRRLKTKGPKWKPDLLIGENPALANILEILKNKCHSTSGEVTSLSS